MYWAKGYRPIFGAFENVLVHLLISFTIPAFAARGIDDERSRHLACLEIKMNNATLEPEGAMNRMQDRPESPMDRCTCWIESYIYDA